MLERERKKIGNFFKGLPYRVAPGSYDEELLQRDGVLSFEDIMDWANKLKFATYIRLKEYYRLRRKNRPESEIVENVSLDFSVNSPLHHQADWAASHKGKIPKSWLNIGNILKSLKEANEMGVRFNKGLRMAVVTCPDMRVVGIAVATQKLDVDGFAAVLMRNELNMDKDLTDAEPELTIGEEEIRRYLRNNVGEVRFTFKTWQKRLGMKEEEIVNAENRAYMERERMLERGYGGIY